MFSYIIVGYEHRADSARLALVWQKSIELTGRNVSIIALHSQNVSALRLARQFRNYVTVVAKVIAEALLNKGGRAVFIFQEPGGLIPAIVVRLFGHLVIYDIHEDFNLASRQSSSWVKSFVYWFFHKLFCRFSDLVTAVNETLLEGIESDNKVVVYNCPNIFPLINDRELSEEGRSCLRLIQEKRKLNYLAVYHGALSKERGIFRALDAIEELNVGAKKKFHLLLIGHKTSKLEAQLRQYSCDIYTHFDRLPSVEALKLVSECDFGIQLVERVPRFMGGTPMKVFEFLLLQKPVVCSDHPAKKDTFKNHLVYVDPSDQTQIMNGFKRAVEIDVAAKKFARSYVESKYSATNGVSKVITLIEGCL